jgi:CBS domain-containing protein
MTWTGRVGGQARGHTTSLTGDFRPYRSPFCGDMLKPGAAEAQAAWASFTMTQDDYLREVIAISATVRDVMTTSVVAVRKDASFKEMAAMLRSCRISAFPVVDDAGRVIGVVSEGDLLVKEAVQADGTSLLAALRHIGEDDKATGITAGDLMTGPALTIGPDAPVEEAARLMYDRRVKRLPVVNKAGELMGIISRVDVLAMFSRSDGDIRDEVVQRVIPGILPAGPADFTVTVTDGIVTISGKPPTDQLSRAIIDAVRHVQGAVAVRDRLSAPLRD